MYIENVLFKNVYITHVLFKNVITDMQGLNWADNFYFILKL
jgi:hypothetical protein